MIKHNDFSDYESALNKDGYLLQLTKGCSMMPMLRQDRDSVLIKKIYSAPIINDVILFKTKDGKYVLHRLIKKNKDGYVFRGDNNFFCEKNIANKDLIGILEGFYRDEKFIDCKKSRGYKIYVFVNRATFIPRKMIRSVRLFLSGIKSKLKKQKNSAKRELR